MKNKNGFTLTELLAIIVIICVLLAIAIPLYRKVHVQVLEQSYYNVKSAIEVAAEKYASETDITVTNVDTLVKTGYLPADDEKGNIYDPRDNSKTLNCYEVDIINNNNEYQATLMNNKINSDNSCDISYIQISTGLLCNGSACKNTWYGKGDMNLSLDSNYLQNNYSISITNGDIISYQWSSTSGAKSNESTFTIKDNSNVINSDYSVSIVVKKDNDYKTYSIHHIIKIDNESPVVLQNESKVDNENWSTEKTIKIIATDRVGSGLKGYYIQKKNTENSCPTDISLYTNENSKTINENGEYILCVIDNVNNISNFNTITVEKIDPNKPKIPIISANDYVLTGNNHTSSFRLTFYSTSENIAYNISPIHYEYSINNTNNYTISDHLDVDENYNNQIVYAKACSAAGLCSDNNSYEIVYSGNTYYYYPIDSTPSYYDPSPGVSSGISSSASNDCDATCQMMKNSDAWIDLNAQNGNCYPNCSTEVNNQLKALHGTNSDWAKVNSDCGSGCTFHSDGFWYDANGNKLYVTEKQGGSSVSTGGSTSGGSGSGYSGGSNIGTPSWSTCMSNCGGSSNQTECGDACDAM
jgi:type IV pilus assembly protein PilA